MAGALIEINLQGIAAQLLATMPTPDDRQRLVAGIGQAALVYWKQQAQRALKSSSRDYVQALSLEVKSDKAIITLSGGLPNLIENGFAGGDMREWMLKGPRAKQGRRGKYLVVPFGHGTPGTSGRNVGPTMPIAVYDAAKKLAPTLSRPGGGARYGGRLNQRTPGISDEVRNLLQAKARPWHATSLYAGMIRSEKTYKRATQTSGYKTFRTISENVTRGARDARGRALEHWFHPGIKPRLLALKTQDFIQRSVGSMLAAATGKK